LTCVKPVLINVKDLLLSENPVELSVPNTLNCVSCSVTATPPGISITMSLWQRNDPLCGVTNIPSSPVLTLFQVPFMVVEMFGKCTLSKVYVSSMVSNSYEWESLGDFWNQNDNVHVLNILIIKFSVSVWMSEHNPDVMTPDGTWITAVKLWNRYRK